MTWIKQNPFLTAVLVVVVIVIGVFGFLFTQQQSAYATATETYQTQSKEAQRLQGLKPYPDSKNLAEEGKVKDAYKASVEGLQKELFECNIPLTPIDPAKFGEKLRDVNRDNSELAQKNHVALPAEFYMGFAKFKSSLPPTDAAAARALHQLVAIDFVVKLLLNERVTAIPADIEREEVPEEKGGTSPTGLVTKTSFVVQFRADHPKVQSILNKLVETNKPFLVIRSIKMVNDVVETIPRAQAQAAGGGGAAAPVGDPAAMASPNPPLPETPASVAIPTISGLEKITVTLELELLTFAEGSAPGGGGNRGPGGQGAGQPPRR